MKINPILTSSLVQNYERANRVKGGSSVYTPKADSVELSDSAVSFGNAVREAKKEGGADSAERAKRVDELKQQIQSGSYHVESSDIAAKMVSGMLFDQKI